jgi:hypothetical protein
VNHTGFIFPRASSISPRSSRPCRPSSSTPSGISMRQTAPRWPSTG